MLMSKESAAGRNVPKLLIVIPIVEPRLFKLRLSEIRFILIRPHKTISPF